MFDKETCTVDKMPGVVWPNLYAVRGTSPQPAGALTSPAKSTPRRFFKRPFPPPSLARHIKTTLAKMVERRKPREGTKREEGAVCAGASWNGAVSMPLERTFGFGKNSGATYELGKKARRGLLAEVYVTVGKKGEYEGQTFAVKIISKAKPFKDGKIKVPWYDLASKSGQVGTSFPIIPRTSRHCPSTEACSSARNGTSANESTMYSSAEGTASSGSAQNVGSSEVDALCGYSDMASSITATADRTSNVLSEYSEMASSITATTQILAYLSRRMKVSSEGATEGTQRSESSSLCREEEIDFLRELLNACSLDHFQRSGGSAVLDQGLLKQLNINARLEEGDVKASRMAWSLLFDCANEVLSVKCAYYFDAGYGSWLTGMAKLRKLSAEEMHGEMGGGLKEAGEWDIWDELVSIDMGGSRGHGSGHGSWVFRGHGSWVKFTAESFEAGRDIATALLEALVDEVVADLVGAPS